jgi:two-component system cell cycle response regulator
VRRPLRILVVDDSETVRAVVADALADQGHELVEAGDGEEALRVAGEIVPDVVLLDVQMPVLDGWAVLARMQADPVLADVPVVMLTRTDDPEAIARALDGGAYDHLRKPFEPVELRARIGAAGRTGQAFAQLRAMNAELSDVAATDQLTGLANRREVDRVLRGPRDRDFTVLLLDIDHFKAVNDDHGHDVGDRVLREVADRLKGSLRGADVIGRWGGEEFVVLLDGAEPSRTQIVTDRIMAAIRRPLDLAVGPPGVTVSIGVAHRRAGDGERPDDAMRRADGALYRAKQDGRDRVAVADPPRPPAPDG